MNKNSPLSREPWRRIHNAKSLLALLLVGCLAGIAIYPSSINNQVVGNPVMGGSKVTELRN